MDPSAFFNSVTGMVIVAIIFAVPIISVIAGAILFAFGLALFAAELAGRGNDFQGGLIFGFVGLAMPACFAIIRVAQKKEPADKPDTGKSEPPPLPPQP